MGSAGHKINAHGTSCREIAIIGSGCRFPGRVNSPSKLWDLLRDPYELAEPIPPDRFSVPGFYHENGQYHGHFNVKEAYFLAGDGVHRRFDASFFGMSPAEAKCLDPQCRLLLETVYEALEAAGLTIESLQGSDTAVYAGQMVADYDKIMTRDSDDSLGTYHASGTSHAMLSNRISYFFDWHGPSMTIDTACSSSLVAVHQAVQQLRAGHSRVAVAAGSNLIMDPTCFVALSSLNMISPDGRSRMWDADAKGYARGEGVAAVVLKTLDAALEDGDDIESVIRETGFAQDGKTQGITSPNYAAQMHLIRDCYSRAGLDLANPAHRPHFFECHGTGTLAGDVAEAQAICSAFFSDTVLAETQRLVVGSIKSIIGHTEGTAGLAGVLKASLALQNAVLPPNLLFNRLNPGIKPFYDNLKLSVTSSPWPSVPQNGPRRASVNSFGFGGANVHAILESYDPDSLRASSGTSLAVAVFTPFVFSAFSEKSLANYLDIFLVYLQASSSSINLRDLAFTLHSRRTGFQVSTAIVASSVEDLSRKVAKIRDTQKAGDGPALTRVSWRRGSQSRRPRFLGIFTGQGAQFAGMGVELLKSSNVAAHIIERLEMRLFQLPIADRPQWSLIRELEKQQSSSRVGEATLAQPLCTAVQILQVDLLRAAGIEFDAVVGHSSGEIAAAYAAGFISAEDAICIAYYRGLHAKMASGSGGKTGAMMAVGTSAEDMQELCDDSFFHGRVCIAAVNSAFSVTVSGDRDAVEELKVILDDEKKFARLLEIDRAYHSNHMLLCSEAYLKSMAALAIKADEGCRSIWYSSLFDGEDMSGKRELLKGAYWNDNMISAVLFEKAVTNACTTLGPFDCALEVGPHPALKSPTLQTMRQISGSELPYTGLFRRDASSIESLAEALGYVWSHLGKGAVDLQKYDLYVSDNSPVRIFKGLPTYAWDHDEYWNESRYAKAIRLRPGPVHQLLGHMTPDSSQEDIRWRHVLKPIEIPWLLGHRLQNQIVFPAAGYVVTALEAAMVMCKHNHVSASLIELFDVEFGRALIFDIDDSSVEVVISLADIRYSGSDRVEANFRYHAADDKVDSSLSLMATARVHISLGQPFDETLPVRESKPPYLLKVRSEDFYSAARDLEYQWAGAFAALENLERKLGNSVGDIKVVEPSELLLHPALLDAAFQAVLLAYSFPDDGQLWAIHVPAKIDRLAVNPSLCTHETGRGKPLAFVASHHPDIMRMIANVNVFPNNPDVKNAIIQVEGLECLPLSPVSAQDDREIFATVVWDVASPDPQLANAAEESLTEEEREVVEQLERMAWFCVRKLVQETPTDHSSQSDEQYTRLRSVAESILSARAAGESSLWRSDWENDSYEQIISACRASRHKIEMQLLRIIGDFLPGITEANRLQAKLSGALLEQFYSNALGLRIGNKNLARTVKQLTHRYPQLNILQVGTATDAAARAIVGEIGSSFSSYTFTHSFSGPIGTTQSWNVSYSHKIVFKTLNIREDPVAQGFVEESYDLVVAYLLSHSGPVLKPILQNTRRLLRPGGHLIMLESLPTKSSVYPLIFGAISGFMQGASEGRACPPAMNPSDWDEMLHNSGFFGCHNSTPKTPEHSHVTPFFILSSQATDPMINFLRNPLKSQSAEFFTPGTLIEDLVIIGETSSEVALVEQITNLVGNYCGNIRRVRALSGLLQLKISAKTTVLSLLDLEGSIFQHLCRGEWEALKEMIMTAGVLLWISQGRRANNPFATIMAGFMRSVIREVPTISYQILDFEDPHAVNALTLSEALLRFQAESIWQRQGKIRTTVENELVLDEEGRLTIPRLIISKEMSDRYNSSKRTLIKCLDPSQQNIRVTPTKAQSGYAMIEEPQPNFVDGTRETRVKVILSHLSAIRVAEFGCMFLTLCQRVDSRSYLIALSNKQSSIINTQDGLSVEVDVKKFSKTTFFSLVMRHLLASVLLRNLSRGNIVVVLDPEPGFAKTLAHDAGLIGVQVTFMTASISKEIPPRDLKWLKIHPLTPDGVVARLLPAQISVFVDFAAERQSNSISSRIQSLVSACCRRDSTKTLFTDQAWTPSGSQMDEIQKRLEDAVASATRTLTAKKEMDCVAMATIHPGSLAEAMNRPVPFLLVDWTDCSDVSVQVRSIETQILFPEQKTYWLAGLSGGLGIALCEWMARRGAKYFVISSRNPNIRDSWSEIMRELNVIVKVASCDVTIKDQVIELHNEICTTMPPIAGVVQGSMVLEDAAISTMTVETFSRGAQPKVLGSVHLNNLFQKNSLDFFVFLSSVVSVLGRPGQSNYSAANAFMASLAEQRRRRGLAASIIHLGPIYGIGFAAELEKPLYSRSAFRSLALIPTSERDFYQLFAEAVIAGRPGSSWNTIELLSGIRRISKNDLDRPLWEAEPLMSHFVQDSVEISQSTADSQSRVPLNMQIAQAHDRDQIHNLIRDAFIPKLYSLFQLDPCKVTKVALIKTRLDEMGIDSLLAVEIRGWFMKTVEANIPVLMILKGVLVGDLIAMATDKVVERLALNVTTGFNEKSEADGPELATPDESLQDTDAGNDIALDPSDPIDVSGLAPSIDDTSNELITAERNQGVLYEKKSRLSFSQEMFWFVSAFLEDKTSLNHTAWARITGRIRVPDFQNALRSLVQQHEILRTRIIEQNGKPMQVITGTGALRLEVAEIGEEEDVHRAIESLQNHHVFNVAQGQTIRCILLSMSPEQHYFIAGFHPLVADGISAQILLMAVHQLYTSANHDQVYSGHQFSYYSEQQHADCATGKFDRELRFWKAEMDTFPPPLPILNLSRASSRSLLRAYENERAVLRVNAKLKGKIQAMCRRHRVTPFHFYLAAFRVLLLRYSPVGDGEDVVIGIGDGNRTASEMMNVLGPFVNFLPLRLRTHSLASFASLLQVVRDTTYAAMAQSKVPFQVILNELNISRSMFHTPLFQSFVNYRQGLRKKTYWGKDNDDNLILHSIEVGLPKMAYDIMLEILDYADGECVHTLVVRKDLYSLVEVQRLAKSYERLIEAFVACSDLALNMPDLFVPAETREVLRFSQGPSMPSRWPETVIHRMDQIARRQPQEIAVKHGKMSWTYAEVSILANAVATALQAAKVTVGSPVAVLVEPSTAWVSSLFGIMRAGAVYLPLDISLPWNRLATIVYDCQPNTILVDEVSKMHVSKLRRSEMHIINISRIERTDRSTAISACTDDPAVILYTSGSAGAPKGVVLKHENLRNWTENIAVPFNVGKEVVLQQTSSSFDLSLMQIFTALCFGGTLCLITIQERIDAEAISKIVTDQKVTFTCATPSEYTTWLRYGKQNLCSSSAWKTALSAGEPMTSSLVDQFASLNRGDLMLHNAYGPTETSFICTAIQVPMKKCCGLVATGHPLPNYSVYVVDDRLRPLPVGVQGEVYIGGPGVGMGYLNQPELTSGRFVPNNFDKPKDHTGNWKIMHRSGDLGRWLEDGQLLVDGRIDTQIKLRGLRIDLAEIEQVILEVADGKLREVAVSVRRSPSNNFEFLVAHVVFANADGDEQHTSVIQSKLSETLPKYMCPAAFLSLDEMPMTSSGKLNRRLIAELPLPSNGNRLLGDDDKTMGRVVVLTDTETRLKKIWEEIVGLRRRITVKTDFFHVGGSSLLLLSLKASIREAFNLDMPLIHMFESSTLGAMARHIDDALTNDVKMGALKSDAIDWDHETALPPELIDLDFEDTQSSTYPSPKRDMQTKVVVLTGATGQLGRALLESLVIEPFIDHIHCIGVRNAHNRPHMATFDKNKVTMHEGDLVLPNLGLSDDDAATIFRAADAVIHNGADMSYLKTYASLRAANLQSTKDLVKLIVQHSGGGRKVPFHYVSTISVGNIVATALANSTANNLNAASDDNEDDINSTPSPSTSKSQDPEYPNEYTFYPVSVAAHPPPTAVSISSSSDNIARTIAHGYIATKWASEVFLENLHERFPEWLGPIVIHRPSLITRQSSTSPTGPSSSSSSSADNPSIEQERQEEDEVVGDGSGAGAGEFDVLTNLRKYSSLLGAIPAPAPATSPGVSSRSIIRGTMNIVPLHAVVKEMVDSLKNSLFLFSSVSAGHEEEKEKEKAEEAAEKEKEGVQIIHHIGDMNIPLKNDFRALAATVNESSISEDSYQEIPILEWIHRATKRGMHPTMVAVFTSLAMATTAAADTVTDTDSDANGQQQQQQLIFSPRVAR